MSKLFFDIETIPLDPQHKEHLIASKSKHLTEPPTPEMIEEWIAHTSFSGDWGRICAIGYFKENDKITKGVFTGDEKEILAQFWNIAKDTTLFIGHNIFEFDLPFIFKRSIIHQVKPRYELNFARYRNSPIFDTLCEWSKWSFNSRTSLDTLAKIFGFPTSKDEMDGSQVWPAYQQGRIDDIAKYCMKDVELTRKVYYRLLLQEVPFTEVTEENALPF